MTKISHLRIYTCEACGDTVCECTTEGEIPPTRCTMQAIPKWRRMESNPEAVSQ